jgi:hypothetical protein
MCDDCVCIPYGVLAAGVISFFAEAAYGLTGFGVAIIFQLGWHIVGIFLGDVGSLLDGVANLTVMGISTQIFMLGALRNHRNNEVSDK